MPASTFVWKRSSGVIRRSCSSIFSKMPATRFSSSDSIHCGGASVVMSGVYPVEFVRQSQGLEHSEDAGLIADRDLDVGFRHQFRARKAWPAFHEGPAHRLVVLPIPAEVREGPIQNRAVQKSQGQLIVFR